MFSSAETLARVGVPIRQGSTFKQPKGYPSNKMQEKLVAGTVLKKKPSMTPLVKSNASAVKVDD